MGTAGESQARVAWPRFLQGSDPEEVAGRLSQGDPLELYARTARRLRERWILLDPERVHHRVLAVCARAAVSEAPTAELDRWVIEKIDVAIAQLVRSDEEAERAHPEIIDEEEKQFPLLTISFSLEPNLVRSVSVAFNALEDLPRRAFFELLIEGRQVPEVIESGPWDEEGLYEAIQAALATLGLDAQGGAADDRDGERR